MGIRQLAAELRLSIGTVSRALNDRPDVNPETRARVKAAAVRSGYVPNQSGRSLRSGRTGIVAAVIPSSGLGSDGGLLAVLEGVRRGLRREALDLIVLFRGPDEDPLDNLQRVVLRRIADAIIISQTVPADPRLAYLQAAGVEYVTFGRSAGLDGYPFVDFDIEAMAAEAARRFVEDGHRRLALVTNAEPMNYEMAAFEGLVGEAVRLGLPRSAVRHLRAEVGAPGEATRREFAQAGTRPTAVLATHEAIAAALYAMLADLGLGVGRDVSLICTFPAVDTRALVPALSHFHADLDGVGMAIAESLLARMPVNDRPGGRVDRHPSASTLVPLTFVPGASHGVAPAPAPQGVTHAPLRADERTQASTKATPATPSSIVG